jgi:hypothetical protein
LFQQVKALPDETSFVFSFWNGMQFQTQVRVIFLCAECQTVNKLVVFRDRNWQRPSDVIRKLSEFGSSEWSLSKTIKAYMQGSREQKTAWIFYRD